MRIEKIRLQNLNSLYGTHEVDLTSEAFRKNNLFLIWGPTGSGKTTILDGITLALYGRTSRLDKVNKTTNAIMSQGTKCCAAEVTFSLGTTRYRASWSQEINRNGNLNEYKRELCKLTDDGDIVLETKPSCMDEAIQGLIKLSYEQFTKAVLLEQGKFSEFMSAKDDDRAKILEQLTGTDIYTKLSKKAYERATQEGHKCEMAKLAVEGVELLSDEIVAQISAERASHEAEVSVLKTDIERLNAELNWLEKEAAAARRVADIEAERQAHARASAEFEPKRAVLENGERAARIGHVYDQHQQNLKELKRETEGLEKLQSQQPDANAFRLQCEGQAAACKTEREAARENREKSQPLFDKVRELQTELRAKQAELKEHSETLAQLENAHERNEASLKGAQADISLFESRLENAEKFFRSHAIDEQLIGDYPVIEERRKQLEICTSEMQKADLARTKAQKDLDKANKDLISGRQKADEARAVLEKDLKAAENAQMAHAQALGEHSLVDLENRMDDLKREKEVYQKIASYEQKRLELEDGKPCPLCGALQHPYCEGMIPQVSEVDQRINLLEAQIRSIRKAKEALDSALEASRKSQLALDKLTETVKTLQAAVEMAENNFTERTRNYEDCKTRLEELFEAFALLIGKYGEAASDIAQAAKACEALGRRYQTWKVAVPERDKLKAELVKKQAEAQSLQARSEESAKHIDKQKAEVKVKMGQVEDKKLEIHTLFGDRNVDVEENELKQAEMRSEQRYQKASEMLTRAISEYSKLESGIAVRQKTVENWHQTVGASQLALSEALKAQNFEDEASFCASRLSERDLNSLRTQADLLEKNINDIRSRAAEAGKVLEEIRKTPLTTRQKSELEAEKSEKDARLQDLTKQIGIIIQRLETQNKDKERVRELSDKLHHAEAEFRRWDALRKLIGQGDGAKFRKFAQGVTFNTLLRNANRYLQDKKLMPRFELVRKNSEDQSLGFMVMDYQTGKPRTAQNLSGGEKFCLSLALALALSEMASNNVAIESLFIDEGLGTLDDQTLDTALTMLQNLGDSKRERLVGLITHVERARETIMTHITVEKIGNGHSRLYGAGCSLIRAVLPEQVPAKRKKKKDQVVSE
ncbi:MAG: AAA family ATPase [Proteobacteria bacterium]|nr:AAA family ATPase [Pseudomonadota bacterium]